MDNQLLQRIAKVKIRLRQATGTILNTQRFFGDNEYAGEILDQAEAVDDEELVLCALELRDALGLLPTPGQTVPAPAATERYCWGARS